ncbi:MAG: heavy metal translocating P-type ATPase [Candidatus Syntrophonatronum acetioxidans]|uniref:Cd(2+)-exporting ATPase n=1 Tax=Candidatus Syntrophonatronum acetioxidans TaxID=1795816 RepID=A0A424YGM8_9FIRM|nr:MAG: heavy metal translocating P-type ATPase [Candidatus Syntrophonatronum acetioxidans]
MIGRYTNLNQYRELLQMKEFFILTGGLILILASLLLNRGNYLFPANLAALGAVLVLGGPIIIEAIKGLLEKEVNVDELVSLAIIASVIIGEYMAAAIVALIMVLGSLAEQFTAQRARSAINSLVELSPQEATLLKGEEEIKVPLEKIKRGDRILIRSGEKIPVDGRVIKGKASVDQSSLSGESRPLEKNIKDMAYAGTVLYSGMLILETREVGEDTTLGKLIHLVQEAENQRAPIVRTADSFARYFTPLILTLSLAVYLFTGDLYRSITVLIVGCPCAFILASPTAIVSALGSFSRSGVLIKGGDILEETSRVNAVVFDKTGTLTTGKPVVCKIEPQGDISPDQLLSLAASVEKYSRHPVGVALVEAAEKRKLEVISPENYQDHPGKGVEAEVQGKKVFVGTPDGLPPGPDHNPLPENNKDKTPYKSLVVKEKDRVMGYIYLEEEMHREAPSAINALKDRGIKKILMLTGDNREMAACAAESGKIKDYYWGLMPEEKLKKVKELQRAGYKVAVVGDGINDAPSLAAADIGIAMGAMGTDVAIEAADIALMGDDLSRLPFILRLGEQTIKTINFNIVFAVLFNILALIASGSGYLTPVTGALVHNIGSIAVVINSARLIKEKPENTRGVKGGVKESKKIIQEAG